MANAGIDESNAANGELILLPKDSFKSAGCIRKKLMKYFGLKKLGVVITDSRLMPLRAGVVGVAFGYAGFKGLRDYRGTKDIFGRTLTMSQTNIADSLATAAVLLTGEGNEQTPLALIRYAPVVFTHASNQKELHIDPKEDIYRWLSKIIK
jgi:F420-0:gamma-glutamyl ligase